MNVGVGEDTVDDHIKRLRRSERRLGIKGGRIKRRAKVPEHPLGYLIDWYTLIRSGAQAGFSYQPITYGEIKAFDELMGFGFDVFDVETLRRLDVIWLKSRPKSEGARPGG